jgi:isopenicillin-N epimerase
LPDPVRRAWLLRDDIAFLNHGSFGAVPRPVFEAQDEWRRRIEAEPIEQIARRLDAGLNSVKAEVGAFLGMNPSDFGLVTNATEGVNAVFQSIALNEGDILATTSHVYGAVRQVMRHHARTRARTDLVEIDVPLPVRSPQAIADAVLAGLPPKTRLLVIDHVTSPTALIFPIERIVAECRTRNIDVLVDGAHAPGMLPLQIEQLGAAYYAGNLHKWCCGPKGSAFLWVRKDKQDNVHPLVISHRHGKGMTEEFLWQGTRDFSAWLAIPAALKFMSDAGWERVRRHNHELMLYGKAMLESELGVEPICPPDAGLLGSMASFLLPAELQNLTPAEGERLQQSFYDEQNVEAPLFEWGGRWMSRICAQVYNSRDDYHLLAAALKLAARRRDGNIPAAQK